MSSQTPEEANEVGPLVPLPKDPQPSVDRIDELAQRIHAGDILLPKFQREFIWDRKQVLLLLDSVARGYPIGSILLWQSRQELRSENRIADLEIKLPKPDYPVNYLLDGQQRLSTICGAMFWSGKDAGSPWNIAYDLREQRFLHLETVADPGLHQIRLNKLSDPVSYFKHVSAIDTMTTADKEELKKRAEALFKRFKDYKIATVTLGDMSITDVAPIFERINSQGTPLTIVDLTRAATWSPQFDLVDSIEGILGDLAEKDFQTIDRKVILRNLSAAVGGGFSSESIDNLRKYNAEQLKAAVEETREAYKRAVDFLATQVGVPESSILPYANQLTVLAEIFRLIKGPTGTQYRAISRWFWRTSVSGYFSGWNTGMMAEDLKASQEFAANKAPEIAFAYQKPGPSIWMQRGFRANNAHSKLFAIILCHHGPRDLLTGQKVDIAKALSWTNSKEFHHVFPREYVRKQRPEKLGQVNCLANIVLLSSDSNKKISDRSPSDYWKDVAAAAGNKLGELLACNLISGEAYTAALADNFDGFIQERAKAIQAAVAARAGD
jgi:hypothetical protein